MGVNNAANRRVLVLGATGKIGSPLASTLPTRESACGPQPEEVLTSISTGALRLRAEEAFQRVTGVYLLPPMVRVGFAGVHEAAQDHLLGGWPNHRLPTRAPR
jgi:uncharacterized protein YbjT (DUF2867 family)